MAKSLVNFSYFFIIESILFTSIILLIFILISNINLNTKNFFGNQESNSKENVKWTAKTRIWFYDRIQN